MEFGNPIVGSEDLIRAAIKSPNFTADPETGVQGWRIAQDGSATFYNLTIGAPNFTIDENGNAVFASVSADNILLNGESLNDILTPLPRGIIAVNTTTISSAAYDGTNPVIIGRITIPNFDITRQYRLGWIMHIDKQTSTPLYIVLEGRVKWGTLPDASTPSFFTIQVSTGQSEGATNEGTSFDDVVVGSHVWNNLTPANNGVDANICLTLRAETAGPRLEGENYNRLWVEDIGTAAAYGNYDPTDDQPPTQQFVKTYNCTGSSSFQSDGDNRGVAECYQGYYSSTNGNQFSLIAFDYSQIQTDLSGSVIDKVELYLNNNHFYFNSGGEALIGTHNETSVSGDHPSSDVLDDRISTPFFAKGEAKWVTIPNSIGEALRDNTRKGIALGPASSNSNNDYGYFAGNGQSGEPRLRITYTK